MNAVHHLGYTEFRGPVIRSPILACDVFSLAFLLTGSAVAAIGGHVVLHVVMLVRGTELPPHQVHAPGATKLYAAPQPARAERRGSRAGLGYPRAAAVRTRCRARRRRDRR